MNVKLTAASDLVQSGRHKKAINNGDFHHQANHMEGSTSMFRKTLIALTAAAALSLGMAATAQAKTQIHVGIGLGGYGDYGYPGYGYGYYPPGYGYGYGYPAYDDEDCGWNWIKYKKWNKWHTGFIIKHKKVWTCY